MSIASAFTSPLAITEFTVQLLKASSPSALSTEDLLLVVESTGIQQPYENRLNLRRRVLSSVDAFLHLCRCRAQRAMSAKTNDPYSDLFMGFESKSRPVLQSVMNHHGLIIDPHSKPSVDSMRDTIVAHIADGHCVQPAGARRPTVMQRMRFVRSVRESEKDSMNETSCEDFALSAKLHPEEDETHTEIKIGNIILQTVASRKTLLRFFRCKNIPHDPSLNVKQLRTILKKYVHFLQDRLSNATAASSSVTTSSQNSTWPPVLHQTLKDKIVENFRSEISCERLSSFICCSCSSSQLVQDRVVINRANSSLNLSCLLVLEGPVS